MNRRRSKIIAASLILGLAMVFLVVAGVQNTSMRHFTPDQLIIHAQEVDNKGIQVDGLISEGTTRWDAEKFELVFAVRDRAGTVNVNVLYAKKLRPDNFKDGGNIFVQGKYNAAENLIVASKLQTKCASKYEAAESATVQTSGLSKSDY
ncbi:MAG: cytochrome c maturation protein CcmE [Candidatus Poribacteria bacterium]|nr:cytochrome c maturation protein CcmE [Candidatus Poribacteria bacterium]